MLSRKGKYANMEILIAVASTVLGLLIGPLFDKITKPLFDTPTRAILTGTVFLSVLVIVAIVVIGTFARRHENDIAKIDDDLLSIYRRLGLTVTFIHDPARTSKGDFYRIERQLIEKAEKEILVLHYSRARAPGERERKEQTETEAYKAERKRYMQAVVEKLRQHQNDRFFYRRVIQLPEGEEASLTEERVGKHWIEHLRAILDFQVKDLSEVAYVKTAPVFLEQTFIMVDERYVIWRVGGLNPEDNVRYGEGAFVFDDPNKELVRYLKEFFQKIDAYGRIVKKIPEI